MVSSCQTESCIDKYFISNTEPETSDAILADINDLMQKCKFAQQLSPGTTNSDFVDSDDEVEAEENNMGLPENADDVMATIQGLMAKCEAVQQSARDMQDESYWTAKLQQQESDDANADSDSDSETD